VTLKPEACPRNELPLPLIGLYRGDPRLPLIQNIVYELYRIPLGATVGGL